MAGVGPTPKDPSKRARRNADTVKQTVLTFVHTSQPPLPMGPGEDGEWHPQTVEWWAMWGRAPIAATFSETDWKFLLDTAVIHHRFWNGDMKAAPELRLRVAKFGVTPEDRARLRIVFADADEKDGKRSKPPASSSGSESGTYGNVRAMRNDG